MHYVQAIAITVPRNTYPGHVSVFNCMHGLAFDLFGTHVQSGMEMIGTQFSKCRGQIQGNIHGKAEIAFLGRSINRKGANRCDYGK